jgi:hypothetical protein
MTLRMVTLNVSIAAALMVSAASHGHLYLHGNRHIPMIGTGFLLLASVFGGPAWLRCLALQGALASLAAFALSRTIGLFGFTEHGLHPAPHALISLAAEALACLLAGRQGPRALVRRRHGRDTRVW